VIEEILLWPATWMLAANMGTIRSVDLLSDRRGWRVDADLEGCSKRHSLTIDAPTSAGGTAVQGRWQTAAARRAQPEECPPPHREVMCGRYWRR
jgi:hypothetical protein